MRLHTLLDLVMNRPKTQVALETLECLLDLPVRLQHKSGLLYRPRRRLELAYRRCWIWHAGAGSAVQMSQEETHVQRQG